MDRVKTFFNNVNLSLFSAIVASLCCITPVFAMAAGVSGFAATFSWVEPYRLYLIVMTTGLLAMAWYLKLRPQTKSLDCDCEGEEFLKSKNGKSSFWQSRKFLSLVTVLAGLMLAFPSYAHIFYGSHSADPVLLDVVPVSVSFNVDGMTCGSCELHIEHAVAQLPGVTSVEASFVNGTAVVEFLESEVEKIKIIDAINGTGYKVKKGDKVKFAKIEYADNLSFYKVPLQCNATSNLGCGSRSKPVIMDLENSEFIKEAWLNRKGTVIAVVWDDDVDLNTRRAVVTEIFGKHNTNASELMMGDYAENHESFLKKEGDWFRGSEVDKLSEIEAGVFADRYMRVIRKKTKLTDEEEAKIHAEIVRLMYNFFLNYESLDDLGNPKKFKAIIKEVVKYGDRLVGNGKMPKVDEIWNSY